MHSFRRHLSLGPALLLLAGLAFAAPCSPLHAELRAGAAASNITPELGRDIIGGFVPFPATHIHDELYARCLVLENEEVRVVLVVCDLLGINRVVSESARKQIAADHHVPPSHVLISATHTHSAASALGADSRKLGQEMDEYQKFVARRIADGVGRAIQNLRPAEIAFGSVDVPDHVFNRRWHMKPGTTPVNPFGGSDMVKMNPPRGNPNLVKPAGPIDPQVSFLSVRETGGEPLALYAAYSLHYVGGVGRGHVSADYYGVFCNRLKSLLGPPADADDPAVDRPEFVAMMANGTSGDINNIDFRNRRPRRQPYEQMKIVGRDVAEKVFQGMQDLEYQRDLPLRAVYREPEIRWRKVTDEQQAWAEETLAAGPKSTRDLSYIYAERAKTMTAYPEATTTPLHVVRIGEVTIGTMPFEVFAEIGLEFRRRCQGDAFMVELAHGYFGYLPTPRQHRLGGYETWLGTNRVQQEASDILLEELLEMAAESRK